MCCVAHAWVGECLLRVLTATDDWAAPVISYL